MDVDRAGPLAQRARPRMDPAGEIGDGLIRHRGRRREDTRLVEARRRCKIRDRPPSRRRTRSSRRSGTGRHAHCARDQSGNGRHAATGPGPRPRPAMLDATRVGSPSRRVSWRGGSRHEAVSPRSWCRHSTTFRTSAQSAGETSAGADPSTACRPSSAGQPRTPAMAAPAMHGDRLRPRRSRPASPRHRGSGPRPARRPPATSRADSPARRRGGTDSTAAPGSSDRGLPRSPDR